MHATALTSCYIHHKHSTSDIQGDHKKNLTLRSVNIFYNTHASIILRLVLESQDIRNLSTKRIRIINVILFPILILKVLSCSNETHFLATYYRIP